MNAARAKSPYRMEKPRVGYLIPYRSRHLFIERFMLVFGPVSSVFDLITFYVLLYLFGVGEALFQTGWFIESITTQVLVVFAIRTRGPIFRRRPHLFSPPWR